MSEMMVRIQHFQTYLESLGESVDRLIRAIAIKEVVDVERRGYISRLIPIQLVSI